jgi:glycosyltransferase 2 family protein
MEIAVAVGIIVFALGFAGAAAWGGGRQAWVTLLSVPERILPVLLAMSALNYIMRGLRWLLFSNALGLRVPARRNALYYVAGFSMTTTPGKLGEALRLWLLNRFHGCRYDRTAALLVGDRLADAVSTTLVVAVTVGWFSHYLWMALAAVALVSALTFLWLRPGLLLRCIDFAYALLHRWPRLFVRGRRAVRALRLLSEPGVFLPALALGAVGWSSEGLSFYVVLHALGVVLNPGACVFIFAFAMMVGAISVLPGGLGSTEATMIGLLVTQHVGFDVAVVATAVVRVTTLWFAVSLGLLALPWALGGRAGMVTARA